MKKWSFALLASIIALCSQPSHVSAVSTTETLHPTADTYVHQGNPSTNYGGYTVLETGIISSSLRALGEYIRFNLSSIPAGSTINSAKLRLYLYSSSGLLNVSYGLWRPLGTWSEDRITWASQPSLSTRLHVITIGRENQYYEWDIKETMKKWLDGTYPNYGLYVSGTVSDTQYTRSFVSKEAATHKPELVINYSPPSPTIPQIILNPTIMAGIMDAIDNGQQAQPTTTPTPQPTATPEPTSSPIGGQADQPAPTSPPVYIVFQNEQSASTQTQIQPTAASAQTTIAPTDVVKEESVSQTNTTRNTTAPQNKKKSQELFAGMSAPVLGSTFIGLILIIIIAAILLRKKLFNGLLAQDTSPATPQTAKDRGSEHTKIIIVLLTILVLAIILILGLIFGYILSQSGKTGEHVLSSHVTESTPDAPPGFIYAVETRPIFSPQ